MNNRIAWLMGLLAKLILIGLIATVIMDLWNLVLYFTFGISLDWSLMGRWIGNIFQGNFFLYGLKNAPAIKNEALIGWLVHYTIGTVYGICFLLFCYKVIHRRPGFIYALIVALVFMVMPFLVYQPAVGMGYFSSHASDPNFVRMITVSLHLSFGVGLYIAYRILKYFNHQVPFSENDE